MNDDLIDQLGGLMFAYRSEMRRALSEAGYQLNGMEVRALSWIARQAGATARELVQHSGRDKAQMTRVLQQLDQAGLVSRQADTADRRLQRLTLTAAGEDLCGKIERERQTVAARLLGKLNGAEQAQLATLLGKMRQ